MAAHPLFVAKLVQSGDATGYVTQSPLLSRPLSITAINRLLNIEVPTLLLLCITAALRAAMTGILQSARSIYDFMARNRMALGMALSSGLHVVSRKATTTDPVKMP